MPTFEYYCKSCKIIFEELLLLPEDAKKYINSHPCKKCRKNADRISSAVNFNFKAPPGPTQGTGVHGQSGVHDLDYPVLDKAIGRSSEKKWGIYQQRKQLRDKIRREAGTNAIAQIGNKITPMTKQHLEVREKGLKLFKRAKGT